MLSVFRSEKATNLSCHSCLLLRGVPAGLEHVGSASS